MISAIPLRSSVLTLIDCSAAQTGVSAALLTGDTRTVQVSLARFAVAWVAHHGLGASPAAIARRFGGRHPSSIRHALDRAAGLRREDAGFRDLTDRLLAAMQEVSAPSPASPSAGQLQIAAR